MTILVIQFALEIILVKYKGKQFSVGCVEVIFPTYVDVEVSFLNRNIENKFYYPSNHKSDTIQKNYILYIILYRENIT